MPSSEITGAAIARSLISAATVATTARIGPRIDFIAELKFLGAATQVPLAAYDDPAWCDHSEAANRASTDAHLMIDASGADDALARLPDGLDTNLAPSRWGGRDLSGGQWQRLAGARAFYRDHAPLLICDEPTSALDPRTEEAVYNRIRALGADRTVVLITDRLGSTRAADRIIVLDGGHLVEQGIHEPLLKNEQSECAAMWRAQARTYSDQPQV